MKKNNLLFLLISSSAIASPPFWAKGDGIVHQGNRLIITSTGSGPSVDIARSEAIDRAKITAADQINGSVTIHSLSVETERSVAYHSEVSAKKEVTGLICDVKHEYSEVNQDGGYETTLQCSFDVTKARITTVKEARSQIMEAEDRHLILSVVPGCRDILVRGIESRKLDCTVQPMVVLVRPTDSELIVRGSDEFLPKHLKLGSLRNVNRQEVYLERQ